MKASKEDYFDFDYFGEEEEEDDDNINQNNINNNLYNQYNNNIFNNSLNTFNSYNSTSAGNFNTISNYSNITSMNSLNINNQYQSFQNMNNNININFENNNQKFSSDNNIIINNKMTKKKLLEKNSENLFEYIITQKGSRKAQNLLNKMNEIDVENLLNKLIPNLSLIMTDKYGNYFSKKLIQICTFSQRIKILKNLDNNFIRISKDIYGTHPLQYLIELINMPEEKNIVLNYIINNELELSIDKRGTNVLKKFIISTKNEERNKLDENILNIIDKLIINQYGAIILICLIKNSKNKDLIHKTIVEYISNNKPLFYIQHPYSNYVIQALLLYTNMEYCEDIIKTISNNYLALSLKKNSNNVVEVFIKCAKSSIIKKIFNDVLYKNNLEYLINNNYGNYVLEKLIGKLNKEERNMIINKLEESRLKEKISNSIKFLLYK